MSRNSPAALQSLRRDTLVAKAHAELLEAIEVGKFPVGERLPAEHELARTLSVSRATVRDALSQLQLQGHIARRPGDGTYVSDPGDRFIDKLDRFEGADKIATEQGLELVPEGALVETVPADATVAKALRVDLGDEVNVVSRTMSTESGPAIYMVDFVPVGLISAEALRESKKGVIRDLVVEAVPDISYTQIEITGKLADPHLATRLQLAAGALILLVEETLCTEDGSPIEFSQNHYNPTRVTLRTTQRRLR